MFSGGQPATEVAPILRPVRVANSLNPWSAVPRHPRAPALCVPACRLRPRIPRADAESRGDLKIDPCDSSPPAFQSLELSFSLPATSLKQTGRSTPTYGSLFGNSVANRKQTHHVPLFWNPTVPIENKGFT